MFFDARRSARYTVSPIFIGVMGMQKQIAGTVPVQHELDFNPKQKDDVDHPTSFEMLCTLPNGGVSKDIADVAIPGGN